MIYKNRGNVWDLSEIRPLAEVLKYADEIESLAYELRYSIRSISLQEMRDNLRSAAEGIIRAVETIEDEDKLIEVGFGDLI